MNTPPLHPDSLLLHADDSLHEGTSLTPPIPWSATFVAQDADAFARMASEPMHPRYYTRYGNPLHRRVARIVADLEGAATGLVAASGMGLFCRRSSHRSSILLWRPDQQCHVSA